MLQPFQCLLYCPAAENRTYDILLAAAGSRIFSFDVQFGKCLSGWPSTPGKVQGRSADGVESTEHNSGRPAKRQKTTSSHEVSSSDSAEIVVENGSNLDIVAEYTQEYTSNVVKLARTTDSKYIIAATAEDKCIRVYNLRDDGSLRQLSER